LASREQRLSPEAKELVDNAVGPCVQAALAHVLGLVDALGHGGNVELHICFGDVSTYQPLADDRTLSRRLNESLKLITQAAPRHGKGE
jgi:hypothetical protein